MGFFELQKHVSKNIDRMNNAGHGSRQKPMSISNNSFTNYANSPYQIDPRDII